MEMAKQKDDQWALYAKAFLDRNRLALANKAEQYYNMLQPSAEYLGSLLNIDQWAVISVQHGGNKTMGLFGCKS
ncbi:hypothetical protein ACP4OV_015052 [Aristida adscensionis]